MTDFTSGAAASSVDAAAGQAARPAANPLRRRLAADAWGAAAATVVALPAAIAFGVLVYGGLGPEYTALGATAGALGAAALGLTAPLVGRNGGFVTAPCAPAAAVLSALAATLVAGTGTGAGASPAQALALLAAAAALAGVLQIVYGALRLGRVIKYIPYQVVTGYLSGIALIIATTQLPKALGLAKGVALGQGLMEPGGWRWPAIAVAATTITVTAVAPRLTRSVPAPVIGFAAGIASYFALGLLVPELLVLDANPLIVGRIEGGSLLEAMGGRMAALGTLGFGDLRPVLATGVTLSVLLAIDTLKTGVVVDALTRTRHDSNRELLGQGVGNLVAAFSGGMPGAGTMGPTLVNVTSGGRSPWSGFAVGLFSLLAFVALGQAIAWIPIAALAGTLLVVAAKMFDWRIFGLLRHAETRLDFAVVAAVVVVAQTIGLIQASLVGVALAILLFIRDQVRGAVILRRQDLRAIGSKRRRLAEARDLLDAHGEAALLVELQGNLFFGTTDRLFAELADDLARRRYVLFDMRRVQSMDYTAAHLFHQMQSRLQEQGGHLLLSGMPTSAPSRQDIERYLARLGLVHGKDGIPIFEHRNEALEWLEDRVLERAGWGEPAGARALELEEIELFRELSPEAIAALSAAAEPLALRSGERLFAQGDTGDALYLIRRGTLDVELPLPGDKRHPIATFGRGDYVGEMSFLDKGVRSADAVARGETELFALRRARFNEIAHAHPAVASMVFARLALLVSRRLRTANAELRALEEH